MPRPADLAEELERVWRGDAGGDAWHGPALATVLRALPPAAAGARPVPSAHSVREILEHVVAWRGFTQARVAGGTPSPPEDDGWAALPTPTAAEWGELLRRARDVEDRLLASVRALSDAEAERHAGALRFLLNHDLHHGGQISLLAGALARGSAGSP